MADVDDELLALVGGDESSDDEVDQAEDDNASGSESEPVAKVTKEKKAAPVQNSKRRRQDDSDEEEGEASSVASPASQESAPMDESDSESETFQGTTTNGKMEDDDDMKYPVDGIYASEAEKEDILAMPELEREQLIAKRQEEIDRQRQNTLLRRLLKNREDDSQSTKKRKASSVELDDAQRKTSRQRVKIGGSKVGEASSGIESLRRARAEKNDRMRRREEDRERNKGKSVSIRDSPERDADGDSDVSWDGRRRSKSRTPERKEIQPASLQDIQRVRVGRSRFALYCFYPGFEQAITGCFVRIAIGPNRDTGEMEYRMAVIKGFTTGKPYAVEKQNGQRFVTDQYIMAAHGKVQKEWPFIYCSDSKFTDAEFDRYEKTCREENVIMPKRPHLENKIDDINALVARPWTDDEVNDKLKRETDLKMRFDSSERDILTKKLEEARRHGDEARSSELQDQLDRLETPRLAFKTSLSQEKKSAPSTPSQQDRLAQLNAENRRRNAEAVRKAQVMERAKARDIEARIAKGENVEGDTSRRLKTKPKFMQDVNEKFERKSTPTNGSGASTPANGTPKLTASTKKELLPHMQKLQLQNHQAGRDKKGIPTIHKPLVDDDIIAALDLDIDVEID
ncbi:plus-3-domain-containing protein [Xylariaceae sp. FL0016]|nr:plus-3-domain-containing protein [Xylariaceae sp. FL0016]